MDYRGMAEDDQAGHSPWGSSPPTTPQRNDTGYSSLGNESTYGYESQSTNNDPAHPEASDDPFKGPSDSVAEGGFDQSQESEVSQQSGFGDDPLDHQQQPEQQQQQQQQQHHGGQGQGQPGFPQEQDAQQQQQQQQQHGGQSQGQPGAQGQPARRPTQPQYKLQAKITGLERTGRKDPILRFDVHTNIPRFRTTQFRDVRRMHSEFVKLADHLISANPDSFVPAVPPAVTSAGAGTDEDETRVKALMQRWFNYVCSNEVLMRDEEMVLFVESDFGYSPMYKMKQPATGVRRKVLKQFAPPPDDTPELSEARPIVKLFYLGSMDAGHKVDKLVKARRGLGLAESDFGVKLGAMSVQEPQQGLANAYRKLGKIVQTVGDCHAAQATAEATTIGDPFQYHSQDAFIVKETLTNRQLLTREFLQAQESTRSRLNAADRLKASSNVRRDKVDEAITALDDARGNELELMRKTQRVSQNLVQERRRWFARTAADLRLSIREYVIREIDAERRTLALLESVRPDIRAIDGSGGLSRLGREAHPTTRRTTVAASQGPKGDAWSGVPRRSENLNRSISGSLMGGLPEEEAAEADKAAAAGKGLSGLTDEDDEDRVDARNAASRLATSTF